MRNPLPPMTPGERAARDVIHATREDIYALFARLPAEDHTRGIQLLYRFEDAVGTASAELLYSIQRETREIAERVGAPQCDYCGGHGSISGIDANGSWTEPCVRCRAA